MTFENFSQEWGANLNKLAGILNELNSYSKDKLDLLAFEFITADELDKVQKEWLAYLESLNNDIDVQFFKPHWVPIAKGSIDFFVDLSDKFSLFEAHFFTGLNWYKTFYVQNLTLITTALEFRLGTLDMFRLMSTDQNQKILEEYIESLGL